MKLLACELDWTYRPIRAALLVSVLVLLLFGSACHRKPKNERTNHTDAQKQADSMNAKPPNCAKWVVRDHPDATSVVFLDESACKKVDPVKDGLKAIDKGRPQK